MIYDIRQCFFCMRDFLGLTSIQMHFIHFLLCLFCLLGEKLQVLNQVCGITGASFGLLFSAWPLLQLGDMQFTSTGSGYVLFH